MNEAPKQSCEVGRSLLRSARFPPLVFLRIRGRTVNLLSAVHQLAWTQHPAIWLCESCAILWLMLRAVRSPWVRAGVLLVLCGLMLNGLVTTANAGTMPVVGMPSTLHPLSPMWRAATSTTRLPFLADQAQLGLFSVGDLVMLFGGIDRKSTRLNSSHLGTSYAVFGL